MILYQYITEALFFAFILLVFFGGLLAVRTRILIHAVLGLAVSLLGVAGLYFYLGSPFLAMMQILIYVGAVCIMIVFGLLYQYCLAFELISVVLLTAIVGAIVLSRGKKGEHF